MSRREDIDNAIWSDEEFVEMSAQAKLVGDALNRLAYHDDAYVVHHWFVKRWANAGELEHTHVVVRPMPALGVVGVAA